MIFKLHQIKRIREQKAYQHKINQQAEKQQAQLALNDKQITLAQYMQWQQNEIERKYQQIIGQSLQMNHLSDFNHQIAGFKSKQLTLEQDIEQAQHSVRDKITELANAMQAYLDAQRQSHKFKALGDAQNAQLKKLASLEEDQALDDFVVKTPAAVF